MAEKLRNCKGCGKLFLSTGGQFCVECLDKQAEIEHRIVEYVRENPQCTIPEIVAAIEVNEKIVRKLIEEGRLVQLGVDYKYPCVKCGAPIVSGQYCSRCAKQFRNEILEVQRAREGLGMRYKNFAGKAPLR